MRTVTTIRVRKWRGSISYTLLRSIKREMPIRAVTAIKLIGKFNIIVKTIDLPKSSGSIKGTASAATFLATKTRRMRDKHDRRRRLRLRLIVTIPLKVSPVTTIEGIANYYRCRSGRSYVRYCTSAMRGSVAQLLFCRLPSLLAGESACGGDVQT